MASARRLSIQSTRSFGSIPGYASTPTGRRSPAEKSCAASGLGSPSSGGGAYRVAPNRSTRCAESRACHGHVSTIAVSRPPTSSSTGLGGVVGSISSRRAPSSMAYEETSGPQSSPASSCPGVHCGCRPSHHHRPGWSSRTGAMLDRRCRPGSGGRCPWRPVRHHFGITSFGINAGRAPAAGDRIINEHDEPDDGELRDRRRPPGCVCRTFVFIPSGVKRTAFAKEPGTTIVAVGGVPGKAYEPTGARRPHDRSARTPPRGSRAVGAALSLAKSDSDFDPIRDEGVQGADRD